jgi:hypothetical protein
MWRRWHGFHFRIRHFLPAFFGSNGYSAREDARPTKDMRLSQSGLKATKPEGILVTN